MLRTLNVSAEPIKTVYLCGGRLLFFGLLLGVGRQVVVGPVELSDAGVVAVSVERRLDRLVVRDATAHELRVVDALAVLEQQEVLDDHAALARIRLALQRPDTSRYIWEGFEENEGFEPGAKE